MEKWNIETKPPIDICPEQYCFCWVPPRGTADLSGKLYDSFEQAIESSKQGVVFLHGGCAAPIGPCKRATKNLKDNDCYEPFNSILKKDCLPELFFCDPEALNEEDINIYKQMATELWKST